MLSLRYLAPATLPLDSLLHLVRLLGRLAAAAAAPPQVSRQYSIRQLEQPVLEQTVSIQTGSFRTAIIQALPY